MLRSREATHLLNPNQAENMSTGQHMRGSFATVLEWRLRYLTCRDGHRLKSPTILPERTASCTEQPRCRKRISPLGAAISRGPGVQPQRYERRACIDIALAKALKHRQCVQLQLKAQLATITLSGGTLPCIQSCVLALLQLCHEGRVTC